ncbi:unnamed protein product [Ectocarpus sp. 12 AP-2014]
MALSRGSQTTEGVVSRSQPQAQSDNSSGSAARRTRTVSSSSRQRALVSPIDASLTLWSEGRRERVAELEEELRLRDARRRQQQQQQQRREENENQEQQQTRQHRQEDHYGGGAAAAAAAVTVEGTATTTGASARPGEAAGARDRGHPRGGSSSTTLEERLGRWGAGWRPPALRPLPRGGEGFFSGWTHLGQPERFELVKSANRSVGPDGEPLSDPELEWAVLCLEEAEERMSAMDFSSAAGILEGVLERCPGLTLAYYRLALCILAARGEHGSRQAKLLLDCALSLEGAENRHLSAGVDLVLRILRNDAIPESYWSEDYPRSLGDLRALEAALDHLV